jgi:protein ImuB
VDRLACADLPAFPLQLLLRKHQECRGVPAAVVEEDRPQARVLWVSESARRAGVLPGQRHAQALALAPDLHAGVISPSEIEKEVDDLAHLLRRLSPEVEPCAGEPGTFWLSGSGLGSLFQTASRWGRAIRAALDGAGFASSIAVGFTRFGTYAVAKRNQPICVFRDPESERRAALAVSLDRLGLAPELRDLLAKLGIRTVSGYLALPPGGLWLRFGEEAFRLRQLAAGTRWDPLLPRAPIEPHEEQVILDDPEVDSTRLIFLLKRCLERILEGLAARQQALAELRCELRLERGEAQLERVRPAEPTLDDRLLLRLLHLRLEASPPRAGVREIRLGAAGVPARMEQLTLFRSRPRRDLCAASQALAQLRAEFGNDAVRRAVLRDGHLPEAQFSWAPLEQVPAPRPRLGKERALVRRIQAQAIPVPPPAPGLLTAGRSPSPGPERAPGRLHGPYLLSGGWWNVEIHREYAFAEPLNGEWLWLYHDRRRQRWFLQGAVE